MQEKRSSMKILIVGGTSSLAHALKPSLLTYAEVLTAGRTGCDIRIDLTDPVACMPIPEDVDVLINTASHFGGDDYDQAYCAEETNALGALKLCKAASDAHVGYFVQISSIYACLGPESERYSIYALSKKHADELVQFSCSMFGMACTVLRPSPIYGTEDVFRKHQPFVYLAMDRAQKGEAITIFGSHDALRNYMHVDDITEIINRVVRGRVEGLFTCTHERNVRLSRLAALAFEAFESPERITFRREMPPLPDNVFPYDDRLYESINFSPQVSIEEGIRRIAEYRLS